MIKVSVLYPKGEDKKFDMGYYRSEHIPMVQKMLGTSCKRADVEQGLAGAVPGSLPAYIAMCHLYFDPVEAFQNAYAPHTKTIMGDMPNCTNIQPMIQISEVKMLWR